MNTWETAVRERCSQLAELLIRKRHDYGKGNIDKFGNLGLAVRLNDKAERLANLVMNSKQANNEPIVDTFWDFAGYGIIGVQLQDGSWNLPWEGETGAIQR